MANADLLLDRLERVNKLRNGSWMACCPAHADRAPSLSVMECEDGRVLIHCFAGCDTEAILDAVGLTFQDVMPERIEPQPSRQLRFSAHDAVKMAQHEVSVCCIILADLLAKRTPTEKDWNRLALAHSRLSAFIDEAERR